MLVVKIHQLTSADVNGLQLQQQLTSRLMLEWVFDNDGPGSHSDAALFPWGEFWNITSKDKTTLKEFFGISSSTGGSAEEITSLGNISPSLCFVSWRERVRGNFALLSALSTTVSPFLFSSALHFWNNLQTMSPISSMGRRIKQTWLALICVGQVLFRSNILMY